VLGCVLIGVVALDHTILLHGRAVMVLIDARSACGACPQGMARTVGGKSK
jgi:hypothetical protein